MAVQFKSLRLKYAATGVLCSFLIFFPYLAIYQSPETLRLLSQSSLSQHLSRIFGRRSSQSFLIDDASNFTREEIGALQRVLKNASFRNRTVIITTLNKAWATQNSMIELFLESFRLGEGTSVFLNHLVIVALDQVAHDACVTIHRHCFTLKTEGVDFAGEKFFMTDDYLKMMWRRVELLHVVLELGYNFVFSDADIMWFRDPFPHFSPDADFEIACDKYFGDPTGLANQPNGGFVHVQANNRTKDFYKFWYKARDLYPGKHDQDVLNEIKFTQGFMDIGLKMRFLSTEFFGGFCEVSRDFGKVCTMHANCCTGLARKLYDLRLVIGDWRRYQALTDEEKQVHRLFWRAPRQCLLSFGS